jgi:hypothetical protein
MGWESGQPNWRSEFASEGAIEPQDLASFVAFYGSSDEPPDPQFLGTVSPVALDNLIRGVNQDDDEGKKIIALFGQVVWSKVVPPLSGQFEQQIQQLKLWSALHHSLSRWNEPLADLIFTHIITGH